MNLIWCFSLLLLLPISVYAECTCDESSQDDHNNKTGSLKLKLIAIASILVAGSIGVCVPLLGKKFESLKPENYVFLAVKFFAAGVILSTGFVHVFPDAIESLENPCIGEIFWGDFPIGYCVAMLAAVFVMVLETGITSYFNRKQLHDSHMPVHTHTTHGHAHGPTRDGLDSSEILLRQRIISMVLEMGIIIHSVIIGISLGVSIDPKTIKTLIVALSFHQMFEGMGLGSCISEAKYNIRTMATMSIGFSVITPVGIVIGLLISNTYNDNSHTALILEGLFNAASAGILIYMALVDFLAVDLTKSKVQTNWKLQIMAFFFLVFGLSCMSLLAIWA